MQHFLNFLPDPHGQGHCVPRPSRLPGLADRLAAYATTRLEPLPYRCRR